MAKICAVGIVTFILHRNVFQMIVNILRLAHTTMAHTKTQKKRLFISAAWKMGRKLTNTYKPFDFFSFSTRKKFENALSIEKLFLLPRRNFFLFYQKNTLTQSETFPLIVFVSLTIILIRSYQCWVVFCSRLWLWFDFSYSLLCRILFQNRRK